MRAFGRLIAFMVDAIQGGVIVQIILKGDVNLDELESLRGKGVKVDLYKQNEKRSLRANGYYWSLVGDMAAHNRISISRQHNLLMRRYGTMELYDGDIIEVLFPDTDEVQEKLLEDPDRHYLPHDGLPVWRNGKWHKPYILLKGSRDYDTAEMSRLINGAVDEAHEMGIETMTPDEISHMMDLYRREYERKHHSLPSG